MGTGDYGELAEMALRETRSRGLESVELTVAVEWDSYLAWAQTFSSEWLVSETERRLVEMGIPFIVRVEQYASRWA